MEQLKTFFAGKSVHTILDIGTGSGDFIKLISPAFPEAAKITGIDMSEEALTGARAENHSPNVNFIRMEGEHLDFPNQSFDAVCLSNAMHHLASTEKTFSEMKRVVKNEGWLVIAEIVSDSLNEAQENQKMWHHFKSYVDRKSGITHQETWSEKEVLEMIRSAGISSAITFPYNRMPEPITDPEKLKHWITQFEDSLAKLKGLPEYDEKLSLFQLFKERLKLHGFQLARQIVVVCQKK
jgi:ubiquinone/menaquinone biosynthesis C-methylase UbiE